GRVRVAMVCELGYGVQTFPVGVGWLGAVAPFSLRRSEGGAMTAALHEAITELEVIEPAALTDSELHALVIDTQQESSRLAAVRARLVAAWEARQVWADDGSKAGWARLA